MLNNEQKLNATKRALEYFSKANIVLTDEEKNRIEVADFGLSDLERFGLQLLIYCNTEKCCAKEMVLFPFQTCPEHRHPPINGKDGKEETFRCRFGKVFLYVEGDETLEIQGKIHAGKKNCFTVFHEIILLPGEQYTLLPNTKHWFQAAENGAVISEFSTKSVDEADIFTDSDIIR